MSDYIKRSKASSKIPAALDPITKIKVIGVGGGGCNAVERMYRDGIRGVEFIVANTDLQQLQHAQAKSLLLGKELAGGLGAGKNPEIGRDAAIESADEIRSVLEGSDMVFVTAGLGGGTGTGGAPEVAKVASSLGALTIGVATLPFEFEGKIKEEYARAGLVELQKHTDGILLIKNENILTTVGDAPVDVAFAEIDNVLRTFVQATSEIVTRPGGINLDFADVRSTLQKSGMILCGISRQTLKTEDDIDILVAKAIQNPLIISDVSGARSVLLNVTSGSKVSINTVNEIAKTVNREISGQDGNNTEFKWGQYVNYKLDENEVILTLIASDFKEDIKLDDEGHTISAHYGDQDDNSDEYDDADAATEDDTYDAGYTKQEYTEEDIFGKVNRPSTRTVYSKTSGKRKLFRWKKK